MIDKIGKRKIIYIGSLAIIAIFVSIAYFSYAFFIRDYEYHGKLNIVAGTLNYEIRSNDLNGNNAISIPKNSSKEIVIDVKSLNDINSLFELYYNADSSVGVGYIIENIESQPTGQINARETKVIRVKITNTSSSAKTVTFGVTGGLVGQTLTLGNLGSSIDVGDVKTAIALLNPTTQEAVMCDNANGALNNCSLYSTIDLALASRNTGTMGLLKDVTRTSTISIPAAKTITLDLNGKTLTCNDSTIFAIVAAGNLTINANYGTIGGTSPSVNAAGSANNVVLNGGTYNNVGAEKTSNLTLNDCELKHVTNTATVDGQSLGNKVIYARKTSNIVVNNLKYNATASTTFLHVNTAGAITIKNSQINCISNCIYTNFTGSLTIEDSTVETSSGYVIRENANSNTAQLIIRRSTINSTASIAIRQNRKSLINIYDSDIYAKEAAVATYYQDSSEPVPSGTINITDTNITSETTQAVFNHYGTATINIIQQSRPMYITSLATTYNPPIAMVVTATNDSTGKKVSNGTMNITANRANACTSNKSDTTSGLCVYAAGNGTTNGTAGNTAVQNLGDGTININGGSYYGGHRGTYNAYNGTMNITNASIQSGNFGVVNGFSSSYSPTTRVCDSSIVTPSGGKDLYNVSPGTLSQANTTFSDGTMTLTKKEGTITTGTCPIQ